MAKIKLGRLLTKRVQLNAIHNMTSGWATFGQVIPQGAVPSGSTIKVGSLDTQMDVKTTWSDGSARFAVLTSKPTTTSNQKLSVIEASSGTFTPIIPTASVELTIAGTVWTAALPSSVSEDLWLDGSHVKEWRHIVTPINPSSTPHAFLRVYFDVRVYSDDEYRVDVTVENLLDVVEGTKITYDVEVTVAGESVFTQASVVHYYLTRWRKVFGVGLTESTVLLDFEPCYVAKALPRFLEMPSNPTYSIVGDEFGILREGGLNPYMPATGGRPEIAPYPDWAAQYLGNQSVSQRAYVMAHGDLAGSWPIHIRKSDGDLVSIDEQAKFWLEPRGQGEFSNVPPEEQPKGDLSYANASNLVPDLAHVPSVAYIPYLSTGDRYYADELAFWGNSTLVCSAPGTIAEGARGGSAGIVGTEQVRARAWALRNLTDAAAYYPDGSLRNYFATKVADNLDYYDTEAEESTLPIDIMAILTNVETETTVASVQWMKDFLAWSLDHANEQGFAGGNLMLSKLLSFTMRLFTSGTDYPREYAGSYHLLVGTIADGVTHYHVTMAEIFEANYVNPIDDSLYEPVQFDEFYGINARVSLLLCIKNGISGSQAQLDWLEPQIPNSLATSFGWLVA